MCLRLRDFLTNHRIFWPMRCSYDRMSKWQSFQSAKAGCHLRPTDLFNQQILSFYVEVVHGWILKSTEDLANANAEVSLACYFSQWEGSNSKMRYWPIRENFSQLEECKTRMSYWPIRGCFSQWAGCKTRMSYQPIRGHISLSEGKNDMRVF